MNTLGVYILFNNEEDLARICIDHIKNYVDELVLINHGSTDGTLDILKSYESEKIKVYSFDYQEPVDMGAVRTKCYELMTSDWILAVDSDEIYPNEEMLKIRKFVNNPEEAISARVHYKNIAWRDGFVEVLNHFPDRLYKREVVEAVRGVLPNDMTFVKSEYLLAPNKISGSIGVLEYDNPEDRSFTHPKQPILNVTYYHLARTRGRNFEYNKWYKYNKNLHPELNEGQLIEATRKNHWVTGLYEMTADVIPPSIPTQNIKNPKISIIITNYNYGAFVGKAIESCQNQTVKPYEIIVVDDCSTDDSRIILDKYDVKKLYQTQNKGVVQCRNWGINESNGDFFINLDADDYLEPTYIQAVLEKQKQTNAEVVFTDMRVFGDINYEHTYPMFTIDELRKNQCIPSVCALIKRQVFDMSGGFREDTVFDDYEWWLRLAIKYQLRFAQVHQFLFNYNRKAGSRCEQNELKREEGNAQLHREYNKQI